MAIILSTLIDPTQRKSGRYRVSLRYEFDDGRVVNIGPVQVESLEAANNILVSRKPLVLKSAQISDAEEAVTLGLSVAHKEAAVKDVYRAWLWEGFYEPESRRAYKILNVVAAKVIGLGWSVAEMAIQFETDEETVQKLLDRWQYLNTNSAVIDAYETVKQGDL